MKKVLGGSATGGTEPKSTSAPPRELVEWGLEPWNTLWNKWEACTKISPECWGQQTPTEVLKYWEQFIQIPTTKSKSRLKHAGRMGGALLTAYKSAIERLQVELEKNTKLQEQLNALKAAHLVQRQALLEIQDEKNKIEGKCVALAERYDVRAVSRRQKKIGRGDRGLRVRAVVTSPDWDPEKWDGNIWSSSDSSDEDDATDKSPVPDKSPITDKLTQTNKGSKGARVAPVVWRKAVIDAQGNQVRQDELVDFSPEDIKNLLSKYSQQPGEQSYLWMVRLMEQGADSVVVDDVDATKFLGITNDVYVQNALRRVTQTPGTNKTLVSVIAEGLRDQFTNAGSWQDGSSSWVTLHQAIQILKGEAMKLAIELSSPELYMRQPLLPVMRNKLLEGCPLPWKPYIIPLLVSNPGAPTEEIVERLQQLSDLPGLPSTDKAPNSGHKHNNDTRPKTGEGERGERTRLFKDLLEKGVPRKGIDGQPTEVLRKLARQHQIRRATQQEQTYPCVAMQETVNRFLNSDPVLSGFEPVKAPAPPLEGHPKLD
ncbi:hypothetical protein WISP_90573 [Willisornis vidua]|uniref:Uncharacterized protein n=1 Tax=Willisornis vidua TaxID=1566151 RepID=A0ABQ9D1S6_9PASS|nr:hypothetical protein WISP_90573 [Willisornis vidua]